MTLSKSEKMWSRAIRVIPGGNSMVSKNPNMFVPNKWPTYFTKAKGCYVWDLDKRKYTDISLMGVGTNILGYSNSKIDKKVLQIVKAGNISSLNSYEDVLLAEKILSFNAWADKVLFARTGAEANSISIRLSRIYTGKEKVAFCGYHGCHDLFLYASKKNEKVIRKNMLPYYSSKGIPRKLLNSVINFEYNNISSLEKILLKNKDIGAIKMEVIRNTAPKGNFLQNVRKLANKFNKILIFDECSTGFRETFGGIYKKYGIEPDMVIYGKALGNGYPISCVVGKKEIMDTKRKTFISSTFWTERIGPAAALETLKIMEREKSWKIISKIGKKVKKNWQKLSLKYKIPLTIQGIPALTNFYFNDEKNNLKYRSFIIQYLLKKKYLASNTFYSSIAHTDEILDGYFSILNEAFYELSRSIKKQDLDQKLNYPISDNTFRK